MKEITKNPGIYCITCIRNGLIYIGSTYNLYKRKQDHFCRLRGNYHENSKLQNSFNKYGRECFKFEVLEHVDKIKGESKENFKMRLVNVIEQNYLDVFQPYKSLIGFNISKKAFSNYGYSTKETTKQKQREAKLKNPTRYWLGKEFPKEATLRGLETKKQKGYKQSEETKIRRNETRVKNVANGIEMFKCSDVVLISPSGEEVKVHNVAKFARSIGLKPSSLQSVAFGKSNGCFGWKLKNHIPVFKQRRTINCAICNATFIPMANKVKYCSKECVQESRNKNQSIRRSSFKQAA